MEVRLEVATGPSQGRNYILRDGEVIVVGRSPRCNLIIGGDPRCSRAHCLVFAHPPYCHIRDLGSLNGTFVNGQQVQPVATLSHGDRIQVGDSEIVVQVRTGGEPVPAVVEEWEPGATYIPPVAQPDVEGSLPPNYLEGRPPEDKEPTRRPPAPAEEEGELRFVQEEREGGQGIRFIASEGGGRTDQSAAQVVRCARCGQEQMGVTVRVPVENGEAIYVCERCREEVRRDDSRIPGYRILRHIARGGMGDIWEAERVGTRERVAIKTMIPDLAASRSSVGRFQHEMRLAQLLRHPNIVRCIEAGEHRGLFYIVMEFVEGEDAERMRERSGGRLPVRDVVWIGLQVLDALQYAHEQSVIHRDLKPSNLLLVGGRPNGQVKVTDFGLARAQGMSGLTRPGQALGTIPFMPPEQVIDSRHVDGRADIFSLGATMYTLLTGQFVYDFQPGVKDLHLTIIEDDVVPLGRRRRDLPSDLVEIVDRAIRKDPQRRIRTAREMREALQRLGIV